MKRYFRSFSVTVALSLLVGIAPGATILVDHSAIGTHPTFGGAERSAQAC